MAEWPKRVLVYQPPSQVDIPGGDGDEVILADLGQELYEAAVPFKRPGSNTEGTPYLVKKPDVERLHEALARYESEVGDG